MEIERPEIKELNHHAHCTEIELSSTLLDLCFKPKPQSLPKDDPYGFHQGGTPDGGGDLQNLLHKIELIDSKIVSPVIAKTVIPAIVKVTQGDPDASAQRIKEKVLDSTTAIIDAAMRNPAGTIVLPAEAIASATTYKAKAVNKLGKELVADVVHLRNPITTIEEGAANIGCAAAKDAKALSEMANDIAVVGLHTGARIVGAVPPVSSMAKWALRKLSK